MNNQDITYWDYLNLSRLLQAQGGLDGDETKINNHELHFIIIHQIYELWFKLAIREITEARNKLTQEHVPETLVPEIVQHITRVIEIFKLAIQQFTLLETMTPQDFLFFRKKLGTASGFQSIQMRELEILLGLDNESREMLGSKPVLEVLKSSMNISAHATEINNKLDDALSKPSIKSGIIKWLSRTPIDGHSSNDPAYSEYVKEFSNNYYERFCREQDEMAKGLIESRVDNQENIKTRFDLTKKNAKAFFDASDMDEEVRDKVKKYRIGLIFIESYRQLPLLSWPRKLIDAIVEMEELMILWRSRHARMVERMIGRRVGTGGSSGVDYLDATTKYRIFRDLWAVRSLLLPKGKLPELKNEQFYSFNNP